MPYQRPTLTDLRQQAQQDILSGGISGVSTLLRFSVLNVLALVLAGLAYLHYGFIDWIALQAVPWTATDEYLEGWAALKGVTRKAATSASGIVAFSASGNATIPAGTTVMIAGGLTGVTTADSVASSGFSVSLSGSSGVVSASTVSAGAVTIAPVSVSTAGIAGNVAAGAVVTLSSPVEGVSGSGVVSTAFTGGSDIEDPDSFRARTLAAYAAGGENGNRADWVKWALEVPGVTRAWANPLGYGAGSVVVYVMFDSAESASGGFPVGTNGTDPADNRYVAATGDQLTVAQALYAKRSVTALGIVCAPIAQRVDFVVNSLGTAATDATKAQIEDALDDMFLRISAPGATIYPNQWIAAINALGLATYNILSPAATIVPDHVGSMPVRGTVTVEA